MGKKSKQKTVITNGDKSKECVPLEISPEEYESLCKQVAGLTLEEASKEILECSRYGDVDPVRALLASGMDVVNTKDGQGTSSLHMACANGHVAVVKLLVGSGASFVSNNSKNTPLHWAASNGHSKVVRVLLDHYPEIDVLEKNKFGRSALTEGFGSKDTETARMLLEHDTASEERLLMGGKEVEEDEEEGKTSDAMKRRTESVVHEFQFLQVATSSTHETIGSLSSGLLRIRELPIAHADDPFGVAPKDDTTGYGIWCASLVMARWMASIAVERFSGKTVLELGAGCGVPGLAAALYAAENPPNVHVTDLNPTTVENLSHNVQVNNLEKRVQASVIDWDDESTWPPTKMDYIIGSDLIYQKSIVPFLRKVVTGLLVPDGRFLYVAPDTGRDGLPEFIECMKQDGVVLVDERLAPTPFYSNPLANEDDDECFLHFHELSSSTYVLYEFRLETQ